MKALVHLVAIGMACGSVASTAMAQQPVTLTTTPEFQKGNNEGLISTAQDRVTRDRITAGTIGTWSSTTALPSGHSLHSSVAYNGFVYVIGGIGPLSEVLVAPLNADGTVGAWTATTALPSGRSWGSSVAYNGYLYALGGAPGPLSDVLVASINADGTIGAWAATTSLPTGRRILCSAAYNGFIYSIGGQEANGVNLDEVLVAPIKADGTIGAWTATTALPTATILHSSAVYNGFIYVIAGGDGITSVDVRVASINLDGSIGAWSTTTALPSVRGRQSSVAHNGFLYVIGGLDDANGGTEISEVQVASINADGSVGAWSPTTALPSARYHAASFAYNGFLYAIGGSPGPLTDVLVAPIDADAGNGNQTPTNRLRGVYSFLADLQSDSSTRFITLNGQVSSGGVVRLQARVAPDATGVFGTETVISSAPLGSPIQITGTGRYVWIRLTLDDTATSNVDQPTFISDITVSPITAPTTGTVNDGLGADIDTQTSTTMIEANWSGFTPSVGDTIAFYEWAIGTAPGLTNLQDWTSVGLATNATNSSLNLSVGFKYVSVRATGAAGLTSLPATSDGVQVQAPPAPPSGGSSKKKSGCGSSVSYGPGSLAALLAGIVLLASAFGRRRIR